MSDARLEIQTTPGASCSITVHYKSGHPDRAATPLILLPSRVIRSTIAARL